MTVGELVELLEVFPEQDMEVSIAIGENMQGYTIDTIGIAKSTDKEGNELPTVLVIKG